MNFKGWLNEGFHIDMSSIPHSEILAALQDNQAKKKLRLLAMQKGVPGFEKEDHLEDLIRLDPIVHAKTLPYIEPADSLDSFKQKQAKIYYVFAFQPPKTFGDEHMDEPVLTRKTSGYSWLPNKDSRIDGIQETLTHIGRQLTALDTRPHLFAKRGLGEMAHTPVFAGVKYGKPPDSLFCDPITGEPYNLDGNSPNFRGQLVAIKSKLLQYQSRLSALLKELGSATGRISGKEESLAYFEPLRIAFTKILKHPESPAAQSVRSQFMDIAIEQFVRLIGNKKYDYILYPASSQDFNQVFAKKLASKVGGVPYEGFPKLPGNKWHVDETSMRKDFPPDVAEKKISYLTHKVAMWCGNKAYCKIASFEQPLRKYIIGITMKGNYRNKNVLMVDDNVDAGGTFERMFDLLIKNKPHSVDIFSPLNMGVQK